MYKYTVSQENAIFLFVIMSYNFANSWQKYTPREFEAKTVHHMLSVVYLIKTENDFYDMQCSIKYEVSTRKSHRIKQHWVIHRRLFILSKQMFEVSPISSHRGAQPSTPLVNYLKTCCCRPDHAAVRWAMSSMDELQTRSCVMAQTLWSIRFRFRLFGGHRSGAVKCSVKWTRSATVSRSWCIDGVMNRDHSFPWNVEFWAKLRESTHFCGISRFSWNFAEFVLAIDIGDKYSIFRWSSGCCNVCIHDFTMKYMTTTRALTVGILKKLSSAYLKIWNIAI